MEEEDEGEGGHRGQSYCLLTATLKGTADYRLCLVDEAQQGSVTTQGHTAGTWQS